MCYDCGDKGEPIVDQTTGEKIHRCECGGKARLEIDYNNRGIVQFICDRCGKKYYACCYNCGEILHATHDLSCALCGRAVAKAIPNVIPRLKEEIVAMQS